MERQDITALTVIDLSAAFDVVGHQVLIEVLRNKFGTDGVVLEGYKDYMYPRECQVKVRNSILKVMDLSFSRKFHKDLALVIICIQPMFQLYKR